MKRWNLVNQAALLVYANRDKYAYLYGANGEIGSDALVDRLWKQYPEHFEKTVTGTGRTIKNLKDHVRGKICYDCSSFICSITDAPADLNSWMLHDHMIVIRSPREGTAGSILWKPGHVAVGVGYGIVVDFANEFIDCRMYPLTNGRFTISGELDFVDYTDTNSR